MVKRFPTVLNLAIEWETDIYGDLEAYARHHATQGQGVCVTHLVDDERHEFDAIATCLIDGDTSILVALEVEIDDALVPISINCVSPEQRAEIASYWREWEHHVETQDKPSS